jgi:hypothetical protein
MTITQLLTLLDNFPEKEELMSGLSNVNLPVEVEYEPLPFIELVNNCLADGLVVEYKSIALDLLNRNLVKKKLNLKKE